jgi:hypothetical protein
MIAFSCIMLILTCWFGFFTIIILQKHFFEIKFELVDTLIVIDNKLRLRVPCQPGVMKQSWMYVADLFIALTISNQPVLIAGSIIVIASKECVLAGILIANGVFPTDPYRP